MKSLTLSSLFVTFLFYSSVEANPLSRIVNGNEAANYQFPWHVSLQTNKTTGERVYCGAALISAQFLLTAASCVKGALTIQVDIGSIEFLAPFETQHTTQYQIHPQYEDELRIHNIAVIRLPVSVVFRTNVRAILLPRIGHYSETYEGVDSYVSGFGVTTAGSNYLSNELRYAHKTVISNDVCRQSFDDRLIESSVMCAIGYGGSTQSLCYGDQGGALVAHLDGAWVQIGIASIIHPSGCSGTFPAGYIRVAPYLEWIYQLTSVPLRP